MLQHPSIDTNHSTPLSALTAQIHYSIHHDTRELFSQKVLHKEHEETNHIKDNVAKNVSKTRSQPLHICTISFVPHIEEAGG